MAVLTVKDLCKSYAAFRLDHVSFTLKEGSIMGFIGRNGAGKTTTLKSLLNLVHPDQGTIEFFDMDFKKQEQEIKQLIGYAAGECNYYPKKKLETIVHYTKPLFERWDESAYRNYMQLFELDDQKKLCELSCGMRVKFSLVLALSHHARLLILDEPTSGLDPRTRFEFKEILSELQESGKTIVISSHVLSELSELCTDIGIIDQGRMVLEGNINDILSRVNTSNPLVISVFSNVDKALAILKSHPCVQTISLREQDICVRFSGDSQDEALLLQQLIDSDVLVNGFTREKGSLESVFMQLTEHEEERVVLSYDAESGF